MRQLAFFVLGLFLSRLGLPNDNIGFRNICRGGDPGHTAVHTFPFWCVMKTLLFVGEERPLVRFVWCDAASMQSRHGEFRHQGLVARYWWELFVTENVHLKLWVYKELEFYFNIGIWFGIWIWDKSAWLNFRCKIDSRIRLSRLFLPHLITGPHPTTLPNQKGKSVPGFPIPSRWRLNSDSGNNLLQL